MRRQIKEIETGACEPKHEEGGALLRTLVSKHTTNNDNNNSKGNGTSGLDNRMAFSDEEIVAHVKG